MQIIDKCFSKKVNYIDDDIIEAVYESINSYFDIEYNTVKRHLA